MPGYTRRVLSCTSLIPVGYLTTYGAVAKVAGGSPRSVRSRREDRGYEEAGRLKVEGEELSLFPIKHLRQN